MRNAKFMKNNVKHVIELMKNTGCNDMAFNTSSGCYQFKGKEMCRWNLDNRNIGPKNCKQTIEKLLTKRDAWQLKCCGPLGGKGLRARIRNMVKRIMKMVLMIMLKIAFTIAEILFFLIMLVPKLILKIVEVRRCKLTSVSPYVESGWFQNLESVFLSRRRF